MPRVFLPVGKMNLDRGPAPGDHMWTVMNMLYISDYYEKAPALTRDYTFGPGQTPKGIFTFEHSTDTQAFVALTNSIWSLSESAAEDRSGASYTNATNGVSFAAYGEFCFASNGVDDIQVLRAPFTSGTNFADMVYTTGGAEISPKYICSHKNHLIGANITMRASYGQIATHTTAVGAAFTNQPAGDAIEALSTAAGDTTQTLVIYGTLTGQGDTLFQENIALNGTGVVTSINTTWQKILGIKILGTTAGDVTVREASGDLPIATLLAAANPTAGVDTVAAANQAAGGQLISIVADGATTGQIGLYGLNYQGVDTIDSQALSGTTVVQTNVRFNSMLEVFTGNLESTRTVTLTSYQYPVNAEFPYMVWVSGTDDPEGFATPVLYPQIVGSDNYQLFDGKGEITGIVDGGDCFFVFKDESIHRFDGPPFEPTVISNSIGLKSGTTPHRQGNRVYFWSRLGLCYVDISTNEVVDLFGDKFNRSVNGYNSSGTLTIGNWGRPTSGSTAPYNVLFDTVGTNPVAISGDPDYGLVVAAYRNATSPIVALIYHERYDCFTVYIPYDEDSAAIGGVAGAIATRGGSATGKPPLGRMLWVIDDAGATNGVYSAKTLTVGETTNEWVLPFIQWPFTRFGPGDAKGRVVRVRPVFSNANNTALLLPSATYAGTTISVYSESGTGVKRSISPDFTSVSQSNDGWWELDGSGHADRHSIAVLIANAADTNLPVVSEFVGIDVEFEMAPGRSL